MPGPRKRLDAPPGGGLYTPGNASSPYPSGDLDDGTDTPGAPTADAFEKVRQGPNALEGLLIHHERIDKFGVLYNVGTFFEAFLPLTVFVGDYDRKSMDRLVSSGMMRELIHEVVRFSNQLRR